MQRTYAGYDIIVWCCASASLWSLRFLKACRMHLVQQRNADAVAGVCVLLSNVYFADSRWNREHHQTTHATGTTSLPASYSTVSSGIQAGLITSQLRTYQVLQGALAWMSVLVNSQAWTRNMYVIHRDSMKSGRDIDATRDGQQLPSHGSARTCRSYSATTTPHDKAQSSNTVTTRAASSCSSCAAAAPMEVDPEPWIEKSGSMFL